MFRFLFLLFLVIPLIEIYFLIQVGHVIGAGWTIFLVVGTAVLGAYLLRLQGFSTLQRAQLAMAQGQLPAMEMMEGLCLLISGVLLLTPGFMTDTMGFLLLMPVVRKVMIKQILNNSQVMFSQRYRHFEQGPFRNSQSDIIEGEIVEDEDSRHLH